MIAKFRFVFWENETIRDLRERERERELVTYERLRFIFFLKGRLGISFRFFLASGYHIGYSFVFFSIFLKFFSRVENFFGYFY